VKGIMKFKKGLLLIGSLVMFGSNQALATEIAFAGTDITLSLGDIDLRSYDGAGVDTVGIAGKVVPLNFHEYSSFDGGALGTEHEIFFLSSVAAYKDQNEFGLIDENGQFVSSIKGSSPLGSSTKYVQGSQQNLQIGFKSPESTFYSQQGKNADGRIHILGIEATQDALMTIPRADLQGNSIAFNLLRGDFIFFVEDMLANSNFSGKTGSDFDYNDGVFVIRAKPIPEPATILLLGAGSLAALRRRRKTA